MCNRRTTRKTSVSRNIVPHLRDTARSTHVWGETINEEKIRLEVDFILFFPLLPHEIATVTRGTTRPPILVSPPSSGRGRLRLCCSPFFPPLEFRLCPSSRAHITDKNAEHRRESTWGWRQVTWKKKKTTCVFCKSLFVCLSRLLYVLLDVLCGSRHWNKQETWF